MSEYDYTTIQKLAADLVSARQRIHKLESNLEIIKHVIDQLDGGPYPEDYKPKTEYSDGLIEGYRQCVLSIRSAFI